MQRLLWIARHEYARHIRRKGFLVATFGIPLLLIGGFALLIFLLTNQRPEQALGYVDLAGVVARAPRLPAVDQDGDPYVPLITFPDPAAARDALVARRIDGYLVIPPDYRATGKATVYVRDRLSRFGQTTLEDFVRGGLVAAQPPATAARAITPIAALTRRTTDGAREAGADSELLFLMPTVFSILFLIAIFFSSSYLLQALIEEKENRTMEIVMTSIAPWQLVGGKTLGLGLLGLTQALIWLVVGIVLWTIGATQVEALRQVALPLNLPLVAALFFIPGYLLYAGCMVAIGAMVTSTQEAQQLASIISLMAVSPLMANFLFLTNPNGVVPLIMSFFPLSAPVALVMRLPVADVPAWQIAISFALVVLTAGLVIWAAARLFRAGMLRYGKRIQLRELLAVLRTGYAGAE